MDLVSLPTKWRKYLKLVECGLLELKDLQGDIHRRKYGDREELLGEIREDLKAEEQGGRKNLYVVKLVPMYQRGQLQGQLPNFYISEAADFHGLPDFFQRNCGSKYEEIWYCRTRVDQQIFSVAGRFVFGAEGCDGRQVVEQVWRCSPRMLEQFGRDFPWPYVRATRDGWGRRFRIESVHIPPRSELAKPMVIQEFSYAMGRVEQMRKRIKVLCMSIEVHQFRAYSLEYKVVGDEVSIIDWDTPDDLKVLRGVR